MRTFGPNISPPEPRIQWKTIAQARFVQGRILCTRHPCFVEPRRNMLNSPQVSNLIDNEYLVILSAHAQSKTETLSISRDFGLIHGIIMLRGRGRETFSFFLPILLRT